jgi:flavin reductase (DIM6/NTAB) family NADH-FMN oxidoreductase RutF
LDGSDFEEQKKAVVNNKRDSLRDVMRSFPQGVSVVVADAGDGPRGITVSSLVSISLDPPLVLVSISHTSQILPLLESSPSFAVSVLSDEQGALSEHFARADLSSQEQFRSLPIQEGSLGLPWIRGSLASMDCDIIERIPQSDHTLFVAKVLHSQVHKSGGRPLIFYSGDYWGIGSVVYGRHPKKV